MRNERVQFTSKGAPGSTPILGAGQIPGSTNLVVVNQQTRGQARLRNYFDLKILQFLIFEISSMKISDPK